jgi:hypothetical protein
MGPTSTSADLKAVFDSWTAGTNPRISDCDGTVMFAASNKAYTLTTIYRIGTNTLTYPTWVLDASGTTGVSLTSSQPEAILAVNNGASLTAKGLTFRDASRTTGNGGCFFVSGAGAVLTLESCTLTNCSTGPLNNGGLIWMNQNTSLIATDTLFEKGNVGGYGGGIYLNNVVSASFTRCSFKANNGPNGGGGVYASGSSTYLYTVTIDRCNFEDNLAVLASSGAAIYVLNNFVSLVVQQSTFTNNKVKNGANQDIRIETSPSPGPLTCTDTCAVTLPAGRCTGGTCPTTG